MMNTKPVLWMVLVVMGVLTVGCNDPYTEKRVIREGPVIEQREVVK